MLKPINEWILTKPVVEKENVTASGLVLIKKQEVATKLVEIISIGPEANKDGSLKAGDIVLVPSHTGIKIKQNNEDYEMAKEANFLGVVE